MADWQPIATAPPDTEIIVFAPAEDPPVFTAQFYYWYQSTKTTWNRMCAGIYVADDPVYGDPEFTPTHWMPLPEEPY